MTPSKEQHFIDVPDHLGRAVEALVAGEVLAHAFGNFHVMTTRLDAEIVRSVNLMKGRRPDQVGSVLMTRANIRDLFDWSRLPTGVEPGHILDLIDDCFGRGPSAFAVRARRTCRTTSRFRMTVRTTQLIAPGYRCACNGVLDAAMQRMPARYPFVTSVNRGGPVV